MQDDKTSSKDELTEEEALQRAADDGIYFKDIFKIVNIETFENALEENFETRDQAELAMNNLTDSQNYTIVQVRTKI